MKLSMFHNDHFVHHCTLNMLLRNRLAVNSVVVVRGSEIRPRNHKAQNDPISKQKKHLNQCAMSESPAGQRCRLCLI